MKYLIGNFFWGSWDGVVWGDDVEVEFIAEVLTTAGEFVTAGAPGAFCCSLVLAVGFNELK